MPRSTVGPVLRTAFTSFHRPALHLKSELKVDNSLFLATFRLSESTNLLQFKSSCGDRREILYSVNVYKSSLRVFLGYGYCQSNKGSPTEPSEGR